MLTKEEAERFSCTDRETSMGELLRRYWYPVAAVAELDEDPVRPVRLLGEDLTLFRDQRGRLGLIGERCAHRAISLAYGIPQDNGLRCAYHGWTYDTEGHVIDMPFEPACLPLKIPAYPVQAMGGLLWAYLGPAPAPLLPRWDIFVREDFRREIRITELPCSWLQCMDNSLDPVHFEHLHGVYGNFVMSKLGKPPMLTPARHLKVDFDVWEYGIYKRRLLEGQDPQTSTDWTVGHPILFPYILAQGGADQMSFQMRIPTDDTNTLHVCINANRLDPGEAPQETIPVRHDPVEYDALGRVFAPHIVKQDEMAWIGQGTVTDRTQEHLVTSDKGILLFRKLLLESMEQVARGEDPMGVVRDPAKNEPYIRIERGSTYAAFRQGITENYGGVREPATVTRY
ncbi:MAG: Rieske 2Fe-2S domain-containing protein [Chloroflexi bacterium]|nr:Rieske 2Fe-2S domain-containing protein [Chloroflexota bacterium]